MSVSLKCNRHTSGNTTGVGSSGLHFTLSWRVFLKNMDSKIFTL